MYIVECIDVFLVSWSYIEILRGPQKTLLKSYQEELDTEVLFSIE